MFSTLILLAFLAIQTSFVQNWLIHIATTRLSEALQTEVSVKNVSFSLFNRLNLEGTLVRDKQKDTLLYAGVLQVKISDWFFLKQKPELKYIGLQDAVINIGRKDSVWNYGFLADYFASPTPKKKGDGLNFDIKKVDLKNIHFVKNDLWRGERMTIELGGLVLDAEIIDPSKKIFQLKEITLTNPFVEIQGLDPLRPASIAKRNSIELDTGMYFNPGNLSIHVNNIKISNGKLFLDSDSDIPSTHFDGAHIQMSKLNGTITNFSFVKDTLRANVSVSVKDRCGLEIKKLKTSFKFTPQIMELSKMDLQTNKSHLTNYYAMQFKDFNKDFNKYDSHVIMDAHFKDAKVSSDDIAFFAPELKDWKKEVMLNGHFVGSVENFTVTNLNAQSGATSNISGTLSMQGLPDMDKTKIVFSKGTLQTNYYDLGIFIPSLKEVTSPNLAALGTIYYRGNFNGTIYNFITAGTFGTQLGGVITNIGLQLPKKGDPVYTGDIETVRFNMGKFLGNTDLGLIDFKGKITGSSFNIDRLKTKLEGKITALEYKDYQYSNITTNGTFQKKYFTGEVKVDDPNLDFTSTVEIDLTKELPRFNIVGDLVHTNLKPLHLQDKPVEVTGLLDVNFTGTNIDNFAGSAKFFNATIKDDKSSVSFDSLSLSSSNLDSIKLLRLTSNQFSATVFGKFRILDLPSSFQGFLNHYYPAYIKPPKFIPGNQQFSFAVSTNDSIEPYIQLFNDKVAGFNNANIEGSVDTKNNILGLEVRIPYGKIKNFGFSGLDIFGKGSKDTLSVNGSISSIQASDSLRFPNTKFTISSHNDHSIVSIRTSADYTLNDADLYADVYTLSDGVRVQFRPSSFVLNDKKWGIEKAGEITVRNNFIQAQNVKFSQGFQEISAETEEEDGGNTSKLVVKMKNVILGDLSSLFFKNPRLEGVTSGNIVLNDFFGQFNANADLKAEQFRLDDDSIGLVNIKAGYDSKTGNLPFTVQSPNAGYRFIAYGSYNAKDTTGNSFNTDIQLENSKIDILHRFLSDIFTDMKGQATGNLNISGDLNAPDLVGNIKLRKASMKVNYTQVTYTIDSADISFDKDGIDFGKFNIHDRYKNTGTVSGKILHQGFRNLDFDLYLKTDKLLMIDTKATDNQQFYGKAIGNATLEFKGPESKCNMKIRAESNDSSHIYIPNSISRESGTADFIVFRQYGTEMVKQKHASNFNLSVELDIYANNYVMIDVILDELTGDVIKSKKGNGVLKIKAGTTEPLSITGRYNIDEGSYDFNFQSLVRKPFLLLPDAGNYISWSGDPYKADMHIDAQYIAERVSLGDLIGGLNISSEVKGYRGDVYVIAQLREKLTRPDIKFRLDFPQGSPMKTDNDFAQFLVRLEKDQNEILKQVAFLIVLNSFAPPDVSTGGAAATNNYSTLTLGINTISGALTKAVTKELSKLLFRITGDNSLRFDLGTSMYNSASLDPNYVSAPNTNIPNRTRVDLKVGYAFAKDKIIVSLGSDIDFGLPNTSGLQNGTQWLPNVNVDFVLSKDKKLHLIVFNKTSLDVSFGKRVRTGVSISYRKDFEKLFGNKPEDIVFKSPADSTGVKGN